MRETDPSSDRPYSEPELRSLDPRAAWYWRLSLLAETVAVSIAVLLLDRWLVRWLPGGALASAVVVVGLGATVFLPSARLRRWGFQVRDTDLYLRRGVFVRTVSLIPHRRVQHVDTRRDLLEQWLGLSRVVVYTAGIRGAEVAIPGIAVEEAEALRDRLAALAGGDQGV